MCRLILLFPSVLLQVKEKKQTENKKNVWSLFFGRWPEIDVLFLAMEFACNPAIFGYSAA